MNGEYPMPSNRERDIFFEALDITDPEKRNSFIGRVCEGDQALRASVESLLKNHIESDVEEESIHMSQVPGAITEKIGEAVGPYKLLEVIGEGGCGIVYRAEQARPLHRQVALKILKPGMDAQYVLRRFDEEQQVLAGLEHSCIAKVYDAGTTDTGRPYFVMELIRGEKITDYVDKHRLTIRKRLELFSKVCLAIQYAHRSAIVHRDIKPSNILVISENDEPLPKLIDFGIAKITSKPAEIPSATRTGEIVGTFAYMSPEQARGQAVDKQTDIYSLGVLLHELLIGCQPFDLDGLPLYEQMHTIINADPQQPSVNLRGLPRERAAAIAQCRQTEPDKLYNTMQGDLDEIVLKCLEKQPAQRYAAGGDIVAGIQSYLEVGQTPPDLANPRNYSIKDIFNLAKRNKSAVVIGMFLGICFLFSGQSSKREAVYSATNDALRISATMRFQMGDFQMKSDQEIDRVNSIVLNAYAKTVKIPTGSCPSDFVQIWSAYCSALLNYSKTLSSNPHIKFLTDEEYNLWLSTSDADWANYCEKLERLWSYENKYSAIAEFFK